jgi:cytoskeletal protein RodZ
MVNSAGKLLREARLEKKISIEEAAHATKIRGDRLVDLERDEYTRFPNMAYAKGFLVIYAKYLAIDVSEFSRALGVGNPVGAEDYDYLNHKLERYVPVFRPQKKKLNLKLVSLLCVVLICGLWALELAVKIVQIGPPGKLVERKLNPDALASPQTTPTPAVAVPLPTTVPTPPGTVPATAAIAANPTPVPEPAVEVRRAEPVNPDEEALQTNPPTSNDVPNQQTSKSRTH